MDSRRSGGDGAGDVAKVVGAGWPFSKPFKLGSLQASVDCPKLKQRSGAFLTSLSTTDVCFASLSNV